MIVPAPAKGYPSALRMAICKLMNDFRHFAINLHAAMNVSEGIEGMGVAAMLADDDIRSEGTSGMLHGLPKTIEP